MTTVIGFLELMGSDAKLRTADGEEVGRAMEMAGLDASARNAILTDDQDSLEMLLGASANVFCGLEAPDAPADGEAPPEQPPAPPAGTTKKRRSKKKKKAPAKKKPAPKKKKAPAKKKAGKKKSSKKKSSKKKVSRKKK